MRKTRVVKPAPLGLMIAPLMAALLLFPALAAADDVSKSQRMVDGHPDLSGLWGYVVTLSPTALKVEGKGTAELKVLDRGLKQAEMAKVRNALPSTPAPSYKPEFVAKVKDLYDHEAKTDPVFYCAKPGTPRIGTPRRIVQLPGEVILFYEDVSGDPYRVIPTDGRPHRANADPSAYGDAVGHWEGQKLVVDVTSFTDDTWFGEGGYFHSDAMHVTEWYWKDGENLAYQVRVEDPKVLTAPWTMSAKVVKPSTEPLEESPRCVESDGARLLNDDHHLQR